MFLLAPAFPSIGHVSGIRSSIVCVYNFDRFVPQCNATVLVSHAISDITSALIGVKTKENRTINDNEEGEEGGRRRGGEEHPIQIKSVRVCDLFF